MKSTKNNFHDKEIISLSSGEITSELLEQNDISNSEKIIESEASSEFDKKAPFKVSDSDVTLIHNMLDNDLPSKKTERLQIEQPDMLSDDFQNESITPTKAKTTVSLHDMRSKQSSFDELELAPSVTQKSTKRTKKTMDTIPANTNEKINGFTSEQVEQLKSMLNDFVKYPDGEGNKISGNELLKLLGSTAMFIAVSIGILSIIFTLNGRQQLEKTTKPQLHQEATSHNLVEQDQMSDELRIAREELNKKSHEIVELRNELKQYGSNSQSGIPDFYETDSLPLDGKYPFNLTLEPNSERYKIQIDKINGVVFRPKYTPNIPLSPGIYDVSIWQISDNKKLREFRLVVTNKKVDLKLNMQP